MSGYRNVISPVDAEMMRKKDVRRTFSRMALAILLYLLAATAAQMVLLPFPAQAAKLLESDWGYYAYAMLPQYMFGFPILYLIIGRLPTTNGAASKLSVRGFFTILLMCFGLALIGNLIGQIPASLFTLITGIETVNPLDLMLTDGEILPQLLFVGLLGPLMEELIFRKLMLDRLRRFGDRAAIVATALLFALLHGNFYQLFYAFFIGLLLGYVYCRTGRLWSTVLLHTVFNLLNGVLLAQLLPAITGTPMEIILSVAIMALEVWGLLLFFKYTKTARFADGTTPLLKEHRRYAFANGAMIVLFVLTAILCVASLFP